MLRYSKHVCKGLCTMLSTRIGLCARRPSSASGWHPALFNKLTFQLYNLSTFQQPSQTVTFTTSTTFLQLLSVISSLLIYIDEEITFTYRSMLCYNCIHCPTGCEAHILFHFISQCIAPRGWNCFNRTASPQWPFAVQDEPFIAGALCNARIR